jgi:hypothetical protein
MTYLLPCASRYAEKIFLYAHKHLGRRFTTCIMRTGPITGNVTLTPTCQLSFCSHFHSEHSIQSQLPRKKKSVAICLDPESRTRSSQNTWLNPTTSLFALHQKLRLEWYKNENRKLIRNSLRMRKISSVGTFPAPSMWHSYKHSLLKLTFSLGRRSSQLSPMICSKICATPRSS